MCSGCVIWLDLSVQWMCDMVGFECVVDILCVCIEVSGYMAGGFENGRVCCRFEGAANVLDLKVL